MSIRRILGLALVAGTLATTARGGEGDLDRLQGRWEAQVGARKKNLVTLEIRGRSLTARIRTAQGVTVEAEGEVRIDEAASPKVLDWVKLTTNDGTEIPELLGIYRLDGDRLIVRSGGFNDARPARFEPGEGIWAGVLTFERRAGQSVASASE